jgi:hypothetical protein
MERVELAVLAGDAALLGRLLDELLAAQGAEARPRAVDRSVSGESLLTALHLSCLVGDAALVRAVLLRQPDLLALDAKQRLPLHCAAEVGFGGALGALVEAMEAWRAGTVGRALGVTDGRGLTALELCCGSPEALALLVAHARSPAVLLAPSLLRRAVLGRAGAECVRVLTAAASVGAGGREPLRAALSAADAAGKTLLIHAAEKGCLDSVKLLVELGADAAACDAEGQNLMHWATFLGHDDIVAWIQTSAEVAGVAHALASARDLSGRVPADYAEGLALAAADWDRLPAPADDAALLSPLSPHMAKLARGPEDAAARAGPVSMQPGEAAHSREAGAEAEQVHEGKLQAEAEGKPEPQQDDDDERRQGGEWKSGAEDERDFRSPLVAEAAAPEPPNLLRPLAAHRGQKLWRLDRDELDAAMAADIHALELLTVRD